MYVQYGCGFCAPPEWLNFDASPSLIIQNRPFLDFLFGRWLRTRFPENSRYGNILKGLPGVPPASCAGVYCSHVLEHFSLEDLRLALQNTFTLLKPGGIFRCVVPDLEASARRYLQQLDAGQAGASLDFLGETLLGHHRTHRGIKDAIVARFISEQHLWMWDRLSLAAELERAGFSQIRACAFNDCEDNHFRSVEAEHRFQDSVALEGRKP